MTPLAYAAAAMGGGLIGTIAHEATHALVATAVGDVVGVGWQGGVAGGPYVEYRTDGRWRSEAVRKAPLALGVAGAAALLAAFDGVTLPWLFGVGVVWGLLWSSPEDLSRARARQSAVQPE